MQAIEKYEEKEFSYRFQFDSDNSTYTVEQVSESRLWYAPWKVIEKVNIIQQGKLNSISGLLEIEYLIEDDRYRDRALRTLALTETLDDEAVYELLAQQVILMWNQEDIEYGNKKDQALIEAAGIKAEIESMQHFTV